MAMPDRMMPGFLRKDRERAEVTEIDFYNKAQGVQRAWYVIQGKSRNVIDFDLVVGNDSNEQERRILYEVLQNKPYKHQISFIVNQLQEVNELAESINPNRVSDPHLFAMGKGQTSAMEWFARRLRGDKLDKAQYIEGTMQVPLAEASRELRQFQLNAIKSLAVELKADITTEEGFEHWKRDRDLEPQTAARLLLLTGQNLYTQKSRFIGEKERTLPVDIVEVNVPEYFYAWADTDKETGRFQIKQNFGTPDRPKIWTEGKTEELGPHEFTQHIGRMIKRKEQIQAGKLHPFFGQTTTHGPEQTVEEGLAMTITFFLPGAYEKLTPEGKLQVHMTLFKHLELGNAQLRLIEDPNLDIETVADQVKEVLTWEPRAEIVTWLQERTGNPLLEIYMRGYSEGARRHIIYSMILSDRGKQKYLRAIDQKPYKADQEAMLVDEIAGSDKRNVLNNIPNWVMRDYRDIIVSSRTAVA